MNQLKRNNTIDISKGIALLLVILVILNGMKI